MCWYCILFNPDSRIKKNKKIKKKPKIQFFFEEGAKLQTSKIKRIKKNNNKTWLDGGSKGHDI